MVFVYAALLVLALIGAKFSFRSFNTKEYLSMDSTNAVRGVFILLVFLSHMMQYYVYTEEIDVLGGAVSRALGQMIVVMFMFYSGYGIGESVKRKGPAYIKSFPVNRVLKTWLHFAIGVFIYYIISLILGLKYPASQVWLAFIGWTSIGNSNWYIFAVIILYIITWIAFTAAKKNRYIAAGIVTALTVVYIVVMYFFKENWWFDTSLCYVAGLWYSLFREKIEKLLTKNNIIWIIVLVVSAVGWWYSHFCRTIPAMRILEAVLFSLFVVTLSLKISIRCKPLVWVGKYTFEIYILMRIPMKLFGIWGLSAYNLYVYFAVILATTLLLSFLFSKLLGVIDKLLFKTKKA
ncbi:MAG: acyltransferase family protein [Clostridia bacterium]|nr:acyltransferase family protein [Clostridia bacterium]